MENDDKKPEKQPEGLEAIADGARARSGGGLVSRRQTLALGLGALAAGVACEVGWVAYQGLKPAAEGAATPVEVQVGDVAVGGSKEVIYASKPAIVIHREDGFAVFSLVCTHLGCIVKWDSKGEAFACPCHAGYFDKNGRVKSGPPPAPLEKLAFKQSGDKIVIGG